MKIVLDVQLNGELKENDIIVFKNGKWQVMSKTKFFANNLEAQRLVNQATDKKIKALEKNLVELAKIIKEKK